MRMKTLSQALGAILAFSPWLAFAFNSGSTGADGAFNPLVSQEIALPPSGVFNFTSVNIPSGVTVTFAKNAANSPVVILASGDVLVAGTVNVSGTNGAASGANGSIGDDGQPGKGGPGGFDGGRGGKPSATATERLAGYGLGPGAGGIATNGGTGGSGGHATAGAAHANQFCGYATAGATYGSPAVLPLIGGSGGAGGSASGPSYAGSGGGGGGGAILIAASGTINVTGTIRADGGKPGANAGDGCGWEGGGGSGGAIRIVATTLTGNGVISAQGGAGIPSCLRGGGWCNESTYGGAGRVRIEAENITRTVGATPAAIIDAPTQLFIAGTPTLTIVSVAGVAAPLNPTGNADIALPQTTTNPVTVEFRTTNVPQGNIVKLTVTPAYGTPVSAYSPALVGSTESATASAQVTLPTGPSTLQAQTTYTIVASLGDALSRYANNERVEKVQLSAVLNGPSTATLITVSGKEYQVPAALLAMIPS